MASTLFTFCRRSFIRHHSLPKHSVLYSTKAKEKENSVTEIAYENAKDVVLNFFNRCDEVTLKKLVSSKASHFDYYDFSRLRKTVPLQNDRFHDIDHFMKEYNATPKSIEKMALAILELHNKENGSFGMSGFQPKFNKKGKEHVDKVVVLDFFKKQLSWCVRSTLDHTVQDLGVQELNIPDSYDHTKHNPELRKFVHNLPVSEVYLLNSTSKRLRLNKLNYHIHQRIVTEAVLIALLQEKQSMVSSVNVEPNSDQSDIPTNNNDLQIPEVHNVQPKWSNNVYLFDFLVLKDFYNVAFQDEQLPILNIVKTLYKENRRLIQDWNMDEDRIRSLFYKSDREQLALCVLMSDAFCRCLRKRDNEFPSAYSN